MSSHTPLSFQQIDDFDPSGPPGRKWCPLCGEDKPRDAAHRSLSVDRARGLWKCHRCGESGQVREKWSPREESSQSNWRRNLRASFSLDEVKFGEKNGQEDSTPTAAASDAGAPAARLKVVFDWRAAWENAPLVERTEGERYLAGRGISVEVAARAGVRFHARWAGAPSVLFPLWDREEALVAVQGRGVRGGSKITYGPKKEGAFFAPAAPLEHRCFSPLDAAVPVIILTEAPIDALSLAQAGFPAIALCGTSGPSWLAIVCGLRRVALAFDADDAGDIAAQNHVSLLRPYGAHCQRIRPQNAKDWNEMLMQRGADELSDWVSLQLLP